MSTGLPPRLDLPRLVDQRARIDGTVRLTEMPRLRPELVADEGTADASLVFGRDAAGQMTVEGEVRATLALSCQRCLERVDVTVASRFRLGIVADEDAAGRLPADLEPLVVAGRELESKTLVEDELLLAVPAVPMHPDPASCGPAGREARDGPREARRNPFAALAALKKRN